MKSLTTMFTGVVSALMLMATVGGAQVSADEACFTMAEYAYDTLRVLPDHMDVPTSTQTKDWIEPGAVAAILFLMKEAAPGSEILGEDVRYFTFIMAHMLSASAWVDRVSVDSLSGVCQIGVMLGAYDVDDDYLISNFFPSSA